MTVWNARILFLKILINGGGDLQARPPHVVSKNSQVVSNVRLESLSCWQLIWHKPNHLYCLFE